MMLFSVVWVSGGRNGRCRTAILTSLIGFVLFLPAIALAGCGATGSAVAGDNLVGQGKALFTEFGCAACHATSGIGTEKKVGPPLGGVYGQLVRLTDDRAVVANEAYLQEAIRDPDASTVAGFPPGVMVASTGRFKSRLGNPAVLDALVEYIKTLR